MVEAWDVEEFVGVVLGFDDPIGVKADAIARVERNGGLGTLLSGHDAQREAADGVKGGDGGAANESGRVVAGAGVAEFVAGGVEHAVEGGHERSVDDGVIVDEFLVEVVEELAGVLGAAREGAGDGVRDRHEDGGGSAVPGDVGDEESPAAVGEFEDVVVVAAGVGGGLVSSGEFEPRDLGELCGQERALDVADDLEFAVERAVGVGEFLPEDEVAGGSAEEVALPDDVGDVEGVHVIGVIPEQDPGVESLARVVLRVEEHGPLVFEELEGRVGGVGPEVVDDRDLAGVEQFTQQARVEEREAFLFEPWVDLAFPAAVSGDAVSRGGEPATRHGDPFADGEQGADARGVEADDFLGVLYLTDLSHERIDDGEALTPGLVRGHTVECMLGIHEEESRRVAL